jgi:hypothetical protein
MPLSKIPASQIDGPSLIDVSANSAATVNANTINFINTSSVTVSVVQGPSGTANVSFSSEGVSLGMVIALGGD